MSQSYLLGLLNMSFKFASTSKIIILDWYMQHSDFTRLRTALMRLRGCRKGLVNEMGGGKDWINFSFTSLTKALKKRTLTVKCLFWPVKTMRYRFLFFSSNFMTRESELYKTDPIHHSKQGCSFCHEVTDDFCRCKCEWIFLQHLEAKRDSHQWTWRTGLCRLRHAS